MPATIRLQMSRAEVERRVAASDLPQRDKDVLASLCNVAHAAEREVGRQTDPERKIALKALREAAAAAAWTFVPGEIRVEALGVTRQ